MAVKWRVEQKEDKINLYLEGNGVVVEVPDITTDEAEDFIDTLIVAIFRAKRWRKVNVSMRNGLAA